MARIKVGYTGNGHEHEPGWFESTSAEHWAEDTYWDGNNHRGKCSHLQIGHEALYRTAGGRWVLYHDGSSEFNGPEYYKFVTDDEARTWLLNTDLDEIVEKYFGEMAEEAGPGRPEVGGAVHVRLGELLPRVDEYSAGLGITRAEGVRRLIGSALGT